MAAGEYPKREAFFAQKFIRRLLRLCVAQEIGADAMLLLVQIATTEDAKRYSGPVTFHAEPLMHTLGFTKWDRLDRARKTAVDAGLLHYESRGSGSRKPGRYWVIMPEGYDGITDAPLDQDTRDDGAERYKQGYRDGWVNCEKAHGLPPTFPLQYPIRHPLRSPIEGIESERQYPPEGMHSGFVRGCFEVLSGYEQGDLSCPIPFPVPIPQEGACVAPSQATEPTPAASAEGDEHSPAGKPAVEEAGGRCAKRDAGLEAPAASDAEAPSEFTFPLKGGTPWTLSAGKLAEYRDAFPDLDVDAEMRAARQYVRDSVANRKTAGGMFRYLSGWLTRSQNDPRKRAKAGAAPRLHGRPDPRSAARDLD